MARGCAGIGVWQFNFDLPIKSNANINNNYSYLFYGESAKKGTRLTKFDRPRLGWMALW
jgi:hypothetical protein